MAMLIQISEDKKEKMSEMCEKMLHIGGKMMQCLESLGGEEEDYDMRDDDEYSMRSHYRNGGYNMRRGGRYSRY